MKQRIEVRFLDGPEGLHAVSVDGSFTKPAKVADSYKGERPVHNSLWHCVKVYESHQSDPGKGLMLVVPLRTIVQTSSWNVMIKNVDNRNVVYVGRVDSLGSRRVSGNEWTITSKEEIRDRWPDHVKRSAQAKLDRLVHLALLEEQRKAAEALGINRIPVAARPGLIHDEAMERVRAERLRREAEVRQQKQEKAKKKQDASQTKAQVAAEQRELFGKLRDGVAITVVSVERFEHAVTVKEFGTPGSVYHQKLVAVDNEVLGRNEYFIKGGGVNDWHMPLKVHGRRIQLSSGETVSIYDHQLGVKRFNGLEYPLSDEAAQLYIKKQVRLEEASYIHIVFASSFALGLADKASLVWKDVASLKEGDLVGYVYPFQEAGRWVTNGIVWFPRQRPQRSEWRNLPVKGIQEPYWQTFLAGLIGKTFVDWVDCVKKLTEKNEKKAPQLSARQLAVQAVVAGQMWSGNEFTLKTLITKDDGTLIFPVEPVGREKRFVLDNPGVGAIFVFNAVEDAERLASGEMTRTVAKKLGFLRIEHREGWEEKLTDVLNQSPATVPAAAA